MLTPLLKRRLGAVVLLLSLSLLSMESFGQWRDRSGVVADTSWRKSVGGFGVMLLLTTDPESFRKAWDSPPNTVPQIRPASEARIGQRIDAFVVFSGCEESSIGLCQIDGDFRVLKPDGSVYFEQSKVPLWGSLAPGKGMVQLGHRQLEIKIEPTDPLGAYRIIAKVRDLQSGKSVDVEQAFVATK
jgi:hypothetical protein